MHRANIPATSAEDYYRVCLYNRFLSHVVQELEERFEIETMGTFGERSLKFIKDLGKRIALQTGDPLSRLYLFQRLSVAVQRGNAASILGSACLWKPDYFCFFFSVFVVVSVVIIFVITSVLLVLTYYYSFFFLHLSARLLLLTLCFNLVIKII